MSMPFRGALATDFRSPAGWRRWWCVAGVVAIVGVAGVATAERQRLRYLMDNLRMAQGGLSPAKFAVARLAPTELSSSLTGRFEAFVGCINELDNFLS
ncbi:MAG: hypothetical protein V9F04_07690 [Dermatophilaceae bacterium]